MEVNMKLSDDVIAHVARLLQLAILTGTDVVDHLRTLRLATSEDNDETLYLTPEYENISEKNINRMLEEVSNLTNELTN